MSSLSFYESENVEVFLDLKCCENNVYSSRGIGEQCRLSFAVCINHSHHLNMSKDGTEYRLEMKGTAH